MTIDELFHMPIRDMQAWLTENFREEDPALLGDYYFFDMKKMFGVEFPEDCNWRMIPVMTTYCDKSGRNSRSVLSLLQHYGDKIYFGVAKKSKYGECLSYVLVGEFDGSEKFVLKTIGMNSDHESHPCLCFLDGPDIVNNSDLTIPFIAKYLDDTKWYEKLPIMDTNKAVKCGVMPVLSGIKKNKHSLDEIVPKLEAFAERASELGKQIWESRDTENRLKPFSRECKELHIPKAEVFDLWLTLHLTDQRVTIQDVLGMIRISESEITAFDEYRRKCKAVSIEENWDEKWTVLAPRYYSMYHFCLLFDRIPYPDICGFTGYLKDLERTREIYATISGYNTDLAKAREQYKLLFDETAELWQKTIIQIRDKCIYDLLSAQSAYEKVSEHNANGIRLQFPNLRDEDIGIHETLKNLTDPILEAFKKVSAAVIRQGAEDLDEDEEYEDRQEEESDEFTEEFKAHCKKMFDVNPELERICYNSCHKSWDAPYSTYDDNSELFIGEETIYLFEEEYGQGSFEEWQLEFAALSPHSPIDGDDLYPGQRYCEGIDRDLRFTDWLED